MKGKTILGVALTLMLLGSLLFSAAPVSAGTLSWSDEDIPSTDDKVLQPGTDVLDLAVADDGETIYAAVPFVSTATLSTAAWETDLGTSGNSSAKLSNGGYVEFVPAAGITMADLASGAWSYWYWYDYDAASGGPNIELRFTMPVGYDPASTTGHVDVNVQAGALGTPLTLKAWAEEDAATNDTMYYYGNDPVDGTAFQWECTDGRKTLADALALINAETAMGDDVADAWELTRVRIENPAAIARTCYIDDVTIASITYNLEGADGSPTAGQALAGNLYRSSNAGESWSGLTLPTGAVNVRFVAVAPDDANFIAIVANGTEVYVSDDAGATWDELTGLSLTIIDMALSVEKSGNHFLAVAGVDGSAAEVWNYEIGAVGAVWEEISADFPGFEPGDVTGAVAFSPNFASDEVLTAVSANFGDAVYFQTFSFNQDQWNIFSGYPVEVVEHVPTDAEVTALVSASISLAPDYLGSDDAMRLAFIGLTAAEEDEASGIFRLDDDDVDTLKDEKFIHSVAYDGTNLVAGRYDDITVYRCDDPLASSPSVKSSAGLKSPGGENKVVVAWADDDVVAGTTGDESAFAVSRDNGKTFNDISLIDTSLDTLMDVAVSADGSKVYLATADGGDLSLWRYAAEWERVLTVQDAGSDFIVRLAPNDAEVVYVAELDGDDYIYYSADGGETRWHTRISRYDITDDLAVETDGDVVYVLTDSGYVSRSSNSGFTWASKKSSEITGNMLVSVGEDELLAGSKDGYVSYSTDGGTTWTKLDDDIDGIVQVAASGVTTADSIYAASNEAGDYIYRWDWDDEEWDKITEDGDIPADCQVFGLALFDGVLYAVSANATDSMSLRTLNPTSDDPTWSPATEDGVLFNATPSALRVSLADDITKLWAVSTNTGELFSYKDTLAVTAPSLVSPVHGFTDKINPVTGRAMDVTFVWEEPSSKVEGYQLRIALDEGFDEVLRTITVVSDDDVVSQIVGPHGSAAQDAEVEFMPETTYYWKVRVNDPIYSPWSVVYTLSVEEAAPAVTEVTVEPAPAPQVTVTAPPAPEVTITVPPAPAPITPAPAIPAILLWTIIIIGAVLIIALIVLIVRTRRVV